MAASLRLGGPKRTSKLFHIVRHSCCNYLSVSTVRATDDGASDPRDPKFAKQLQKPHIEFPKHHSMDVFSKEPVKGKVYDKLPFRIKLEAGKKYSFCTCGYSKAQPFCDGSHKAPNFSSSRPFNIRYRPIPFTVNETKEYWLCMCKQSNKRPFCDGSHKRLDERGQIRAS